MRVSQQQTHTTTWDRSTTWGRTTTWGHRPGTTWGR
jgi:hypothetical protein